MKETLKISGTLTCVCVICAFLLAFAFNAAKEKIEINAKKRINESIFKIAPSTAKVEKIPEKKPAVYKLRNDNHELVGYAFLAEGQGYQGKIRILAVGDLSLNTLRGIEIIDSVETPGLGAKIQQDPFKGQFKNLGTIPKLEYVKETPQPPNQIQAITGATISSKAVVNILNHRIAKLKDELKL